MQQSKRRRGVQVTYLKKCTATKLKPRAIRIAKELQVLFFAHTWTRSDTRLVVKCKGRKAAADTRPKYKNCAKCGETT